jgi:hypothetical protein
LSEREETIIEEMASENDVQSMRREKHEEEKEAEIEEDINEEENNYQSTSLTESQHSEMLNNAKYNFRKDGYAFLSLKTGVKMWGEKGMIARRDELQMLLDEEVFEQIVDPTEEQKRKAFRMHCFVVEKRDIRIKPRAVADGRTQTRYTEEETYSPLVKLESIM